MAVKKLPPFSADAPVTQAMFDALLREIELASKFNSDRWGGLGLRRSRLLEESCFRKLLASPFS